MKTKVREFEETTWKNFVLAHPSYKLTKTCLDLVSPHMLWSVSNHYPDSATHLYVQIRHMGDFDLSDCSYFRMNFDSLWSNLDVKALNSSPTDGSQISAFIKNLERHSKALLLPVCLPLPFDSMTLRVITRFVTSAIGKIYK